MFVWLQSLITAVVSFLTSVAGVRLVTATTFVTVYLGLYSALATSVHTLVASTVSGVNSGGLGAYSATFWDWLWYVLPANTGNYVSAVVSAEASAAIYRWRVKVLTVRVG